MVPALFLRPLIRHTAAMPMRAHTATPPPAAPAMTTMGDVGLLLFPPGGGGTPDAPGDDDHDGAPDGGVM